MLKVKAERTGKFQYSAFHEHKGGFVVIVRNAKSFSEMSEIVRNYWTRWTTESTCLMTYNDYYENKEMQ